MSIVVDTESRSLVAFGQTFPVAIGRGGAVAASGKREGDGATPLGRWAVEALLVRPDRLSAPETALPWRWLRPWDGWCDAAGDRSYNQPVIHPYSASAERLWRDDHAYDLILILSHNRHPVVAGAGSAIFWHVAQPDWRPTEGCVAMDGQALWSLLPLLKTGMEMQVR
jgi:L,D-peptidoglycan transpeptidase YkuD (ErfK/YbiS/YcfS/YnhG family)